MARRQLNSVEAILASIESIDIDSHRLDSLIEPLRQTLIPALVRFLEVTPLSMRARLNAASILLRLGDSRGTLILIGCLAAEDAFLRRSAWIELQAFAVGQYSRERGRQALDQSVVASALQPYLDRLSSTTEDAYAAELDTALHIALYLDHQWAFPVMKRFLHHPIPNVRLKVLYVAAERWPTMEALDVAEQIVASPSLLHDHAYWMISTLERFCTGENAAIVHRAASMLAYFCYEYADRGSSPREAHEVTNWLRVALPALAKAQYVHRRNVFERVYQSEVADSRRGISLYQLALLDGRAWEDELFAGLHDPVLRYFAAKAIAEGAVGLGNERFGEALVTALQESENDHTKSVIVTAIKAVHTNPTLILARYAETLNPQVTMDLFWRVEGITPHIAARWFVAAGVIPRLPQEAIKRHHQAWKLHNSPVRVVISLLEEANRYIHFDSEDMHAPPDYIALIEQIAEKSGGAFRPYTVDQVWSGERKDSFGDNGPVTITFIHNGKSHSIEAAYFGDGVDVDSLFRGVNLALADSGRPHRIIPLYTGDQTVAAVCAPEAKMRATARKLHLLLADEMESH